MKIANQQPSFLNAREVATRYGVAVSTVWRWGQAGVFPSPVKLGPGCTRWRLEDLESFEASREVRA